MTQQNPPQIEHHIARCRLILSVVAMGAVFLDPTQPFVSGWLPMSTGRFTIDPYVFSVMVLHLLYSLAVYFAVARRWIAIGTIATGTLYSDVLLGAAIAFLTEGATSPFYAFFAFAVVAAGFRSGMRQAMNVTAASVLLYLGLIVISSPGNLNLYIMRPAYLAIVGYLVGYLGQQRIELQQEVRLLEATEQRHRIARDLHDGFAQAMAGINLKIESCLRLLRRGAGGDAQEELSDLQASVRREYDELRDYMQSLAGVRPSPAAAGLANHADVSLNIEVRGSLDLVDHVLQIAREGLNNVRRHSKAQSAHVRILQEDGFVRIAIDDDGIGQIHRNAPWSIASRVRELGGRVQVSTDAGCGLHLQILLPQG